MRHARWLLPLTLATAAAAQPVDALHAPACQQALAALEAEESAARAELVGGAGAEVDAPAKARVLARQKFAARSCLGAWMEAVPQASRAYQAPTRVSPVPGLVMRPAPVVVATPPSAVLAQPAPKPSIASCSPAGCINSDGTWLPRGSGALLGPQGVLNQPRPTPGQH